MNVMLGDICEIVIGKTPSRNKPEFWGPGFKWVAISDLGDEKYISNTKEEITPAAVLAGGCKKIPKNTLLLSFKLSIGKMAITTEDMFTNEAIAALIIKDDKLTTPEFLYFALKMADIKKETDKAVKGLTLNKPKLQRIQIYLPSKKEQDHIVSVMTKAYELVDMRKRTIKLMDNLLESTFYELFGDPLINPKGWPLKPISSIGRVVTGNTPSRQVSEYYGDHIEWIKSDNINTPFHFLTAAEEKLSIKGMEVGRTVPKGAVLVTCIAGSKSCIGNAAMVNREVSFNQQINGVVPDLEQVTQIFLYSHILWGKKLIQNASTSGMKGMVSKTAFENLKFMVPPLALQIKYEKKFKTILDTITAYDNQKDKINLMINSLLKEFFKNGLTGSN